MKLREFDNKRVRITCKNGEVFEGVCEYNDAEYCEIELGRNEESLEIMNFLFYKSEIKNVESLERFSESYGAIEEYYTQDGIEELRDVLLDEDKENILRLIRCVEDKLKKADYPYRDKAIEALSDAAEYSNDEEIKAEAKRILDK